jgi:hypothetical protein
MYKYSWGFDKAFDFICSKRPSIDVKDGTRELSADLKSRTDPMLPTFAGFVLQLLNLESRIKERNLGLLNGSDPRAVARFSDWSASYLIPSVSSSLSDCFDDSNSSRPQNVTDYAQLFSEADNDSSNGVNVLAEYSLDEAVIINCFINSRSYSAVEAEADAAKAAADAETRR